MYFIIDPGYFYKKQKNQKMGDRDSQRIYIINEI